MSISHLAGSQHLAGAHAAHRNPLYTEYEVMKGDDWLSGRSFVQEEKSNKIKTC
jgi:hypothetical protein